MAAPIPTRKPSLLVNGLPSVQEGEPAQTTTTTQSTTPSTSTLSLPPSAPSSASPSRGDAKMNMLRRMRPPPLQYAWTFYHDKHNDNASYEGRLTVLLENIMTAKKFWEAYNWFPLDALKMKDSVHFFKRGVKPVWEDSRNVNGGAWTFRVPKDKSSEVWKEFLLLAIGEQFSDVIQPKDDLCGLSLSIRFNSNLIQIWNRNGEAQKTIDGILSTVLAKISPELKPKEGSYYYKRHSEHAGFSEVVARARAAAEANLATAGGKIEEARVREGEVEQQEAIEEAREEEERAKRARSQTIA